MKSFGYGIPEMAADLRVIIADASSEREMIEQALHLVQWMAQRAEAWLPSHRFKADSDRGFGVNLLHEEPGNALTICAVAWPPGGHVPPHDHHSWEILAPMYGTMRHSSWAQADSGSRADHPGTREASEIVMRPGQAVAIMPREIHALEGVSPGPGLTIHIYGKGLAEMGRNRSATGKPDEVSAEVRQAGI